MVHPVGEDAVANLDVAGRVLDDLTARESFQWARYARVVPRSAARPFSTAASSAFTKSVAVFIGGGWNFGPSFGAMSSSSIPMTIPIHSGMLATIIAT